MPLTRMKIIRGLISLSWGQSSPHFSRIPRPKFSTSTSDFFTSSFTSSRPLGVCILTVNDFLPRWSFMKSGFMFHNLGSSPRWPSPRRRVSQRITSAPNSQSTRATVGPAAPVVSSTTRIPSRGNLLIIRLLFLNPVRAGCSITQYSSIPTLHYANLFKSLLGSERDEIVAGHAQLAAINLFIVLAKQRSRAAYAAGRFTKSRHRTKLCVLADDRMYPCRRKSRALLLARC